MAATTTLSRQSDYTSEVRALNTTIWNAIIELKGMQEEWNKATYGAGALADGVGANEGITGAEVGDVVFDVADALVAVLESGHGGNMAKLL